jgi:mRNA interferase MazF
VRRGDLYDTRLDPIEGSEQAGTRPAIIVSRDAINTHLSIVVVVPCTTYRPTTRLHPGRILLHAPDGGLGMDSVALCEQVRTVAKSRLLRRRGTLSPPALAQVERGLLITLDLLGVPKANVP